MDQIDRIYDYHLGDDGGSNTVWDQPFLMPIGTKFLHEYGLYEVLAYVDAEGEYTKTTNKIKGLVCERRKTNSELKNKNK